MIVDRQTPPKKTGETNEIKKIWQDRQAHGANIPRIGDALFIIFQLFGGYLCLLSGGNVLRVEVTRSRGVTKDDDGGGCRVRCLFSFKLRLPTPYPFTISVYHISFHLSQTKLWRCLPHWSHRDWRFFTFIYIYYLYYQRFIFKEWWNHSLQCPLFDWWTPFPTNPQYKVEIQRKKIMSSTLKMMT